MEVIQKIKIDGKDAKLILLSDKKTVQVTYDNTVIYTSAGKTWKNIESEEWAQIGLLKIETEKYIKNKSTLNKLQKLAEEYF